MDYGITGKKGFECPTCGTQYFVPVYTDDFICRCENKRDVFDITKSNYYLQKNKNYTKQFDTYMRLVD